LSPFKFDSFDDRQIEAFKRAFATAEPFPHIVLDNVIADDPAALDATFPPPEWTGWKRFRDDYQVGKMFCQDLAVIPEPWSSMLRELNEPKFLGFLESISGVDKLIPDPYLEGGGLHASGPAGILAPHTDFHIYVRLDVYRQLNVLIYLNDGWTEDDGGCLELYAPDEDEPRVTVVPTFGRCVIFRTDDRSIHGFSKPVQTTDRLRRSLALYYYTSTESEGYSGDTTTYWRQHGELGGAKRVRLATYRGLLFGARALASLAHRTNPNLGSRRRPT
jgi:hypothetical protein